MFQLRFTWVLILERWIVGDNLQNWYWYVEHRERKQISGKEGMKTRTSQEWTFARNHGHRVCRRMK